MNEDVGTVLRMDTIADLSSSVIRSYATEKELIKMGTDDKNTSELVKILKVDGTTIKEKSTPAINVKQVFKGTTVKGLSDSFPILSRGNTAYRLTSLKQSDDVEINLEFQNPAKKS